MKQDYQKFLVVALISALVIGLDQYTKHLVVTPMPLYGRIELIPGVLDLIHIRNSGIAFGLLKQFGSQYKLAAMLLVSAVALVLLAVLVTQVKKHQKLQLLCLSLILGGAVGNLIDRFRLGEVVDFIDAHWRNLYHWPAFNVADSAITVGIVLMLLDEIVLKKKQNAQHKP
jgi:signal peptidase II